MKMIATVILGIIAMLGFQGQDSLMDTGKPDTISYQYDSIRNASPEYKEIKTNSIGNGEELIFQISFGWFTVGKGKMVVNKNNYRVNHRDCYKIDIYGKTSGMVDWVAKVDDHWGAYVDTSALVTHIAYRNIKEGRYRRNEITKFDHITDNIEVKILNQKTGNYFEPVYYQAPDNMRDMVGGFFYLRSVDYSSRSVGDTINVNGFFEDTFYNMDIIYEGKEQIKTKLGTFDTIKLVPVMPDNNLFDGENSITAWLSDDENKIPVKIEAEMFIGHAGVELIEVNNLRNKLNVKTENKE